MRNKERKKQNLYLMAYYIKMGKK